MEHHTSDARSCVACARPAPNARKGMCGRCYQARWKGAAHGPACEVCSVADPRVMVRRRMPLEDGALVWRTLCANCTTIAGKRPLTLGELAREVRPTGDRRRAGDRRRNDRRAAAGDRRIDREGIGDRRETQRRA